MSNNRRGIIQAALFFATVITTTLAGAENSFGKSVYMVDAAGSIHFNADYTWGDFLSGLQFSIPFLLILTVHEFGHYFTALYHKVKATLPFYIPMPPLPLFNIGTLGAVIRLQQRVASKKQNFDIGIAGPLAGFVMAMIILFYGFTHLPEPEYIFQVHPEYKAYGLNYAEKVYQPGDKDIMDILVGDNLIFMFFKTYVADPARMPNPHELIHYPLLFAGYLALFFTFLNLLPIGQLDGGHVVYGLFGYKKHKIIATVFFIAFTFYAGLGVFNPTDFPVQDLSLSVPLILIAIWFVYIMFIGLGLPKRDTLMYALLMITVLFVLGRFKPTWQGYSGFLPFAFLLGRFVGIQHPPSDIEEPLDTTRVILGWIALIIFILCFSPVPLDIVVVEKVKATALSLPAGSFSTYFAGLPIG
jgi:membrane-associated protease RseP (regulator of RpoE activity)